MQAIEGGKSNYAKKTSELMRRGQRVVAFLIFSNEYARKISSRLFLMKMKNENILQSFNLLACVCAFEYSQLKEQSK
jgi:hypothetical protein